MFENEDMPFLLGIGAFFTMIILLIAIATWSEIDSRSCKVKLATTSALSVEDIEKICK